MTAPAEMMLQSIDQIAAAGEKPKGAYLYPGQLIVTNEPSLVTTILGSCIAICLWDAQSWIAGINHYLLPRNPLRGQADARYGDTATERLIADMVSRGAVISRLTAKLVGGAAVMTAFSARQKSIGEQNVEVARELLTKLGIPIVAEQAGGQRGRKLLFHTGNGCAYSKEI
ncbi:MAG TPA: chemotaxis protein CheD [Thermoanaerobaculia bacterium]|nr:chemotaxis protein CheD [Thermoanaerobaculia bacterium]